MIQSTLIRFRNFRIPHKNRSIDMCEIHIKTHLVLRVMNRDGKKTVCDPIKFGVRHNQ